MHQYKTISSRVRYSKPENRENLALSHGADIGKGVEISPRTLTYLQKFFGKKPWDITIKDNAKVQHLVHMSSGVFIDEGAIVYGPEATRWNYLEERQVKIENTSRHLTLKKNVHVGKSSRIQSAHNKTIGENVFIADNVIIEAAVSSIGDNTLIGEGVELFAHSVGKNCVINRILVICKGEYKSQSQLYYGFSGVKIPDGVKVYENIRIDFSRKSNQYSAGFRELRFSQINNDGYLEKLFSIPNLVIMPHTVINWETYSKIIEAAKNKEQDVYLIVKNNRVFKAKLKDQMPSNTQSPNAFIKQNRLRPSKKKNKLYKHIASLYRYLLEAFRDHRVIQVVNQGRPYRFRRFNNTGMKSYMRNNHTRKTTG